MRPAPGHSHNHLPISDGSSSVIAPRTRVFMRGLSAVGTGHHRAQKGTVKQAQRVHQSSFQAPATTTAVSILAHECGVIIAVRLRFVSSRITMLAELGTVLRGLSVAFVGVGAALAMSDAAAAAARLVLHALSA
jgi:hypothetical protein